MKTTETEVVEKNELAAIISESGLEATTSESIIKKFEPFFLQMKEWEDKAKSLVVTDATQLTEMAQAREARLSLKKIRTGSEKLKDVMKADSIAYGKAVQSVFNFISNGIAPIEKHLQEQEDFAKIQEQKRKVALGEERALQLKGFEVAVDFYDLPNMAEADFNILLSNAKAGYEKRMDDARIEKEQKEKAEREEKLRAERSALLLSVGAKEVDGNIVLECEDFVDACNTLSIAELGTHSEDAFNAYYEEYKSTASENAKHREKVKQDNIRLQKEAEEREKEVAAKNQLRLERNAILKKYNYFHDTDVADLGEERFAELAQEAEHLFNEEEKKRIEAEEAEAEANERRKNELKEEREKAAKLELQLKEKAAAEEKQKREAEERAEAELKMGDKAKMQSLQSDLQLLTTKYTFKSKAYKLIYSQVIELLNKVINHIVSKQ